MTTHKKINFLNRPEPPKTNVCVPESKVRELVSKMRKRIEELEEALQRLSPSLPDELRERSRAVWQLALQQHQSGKEGEPGPAGIIARAIREAEEKVREELNAVAMMDKPVKSMVAKPVKRKPKTKTTHPQKKTQRRKGKR